MVTNNSNLFHSAGRLAFPLLMMLLGACTSAESSAPASDGSLAAGHAKALMEACHEKSDSSNYVIIEEGMMTANMSSLEDLVRLNGLQELEAEGLLNIELVGDGPDSNGNRQYICILNSAARALGENVGRGSNGPLSRFFSHRDSVAEVMTVHEVPALNSATVKIRWAQADATPYGRLYVKAGTQLDLDNPGGYFEEYTYLKTNNGWIYCD